MLEFGVHCFFACKNNHNVEIGEYASHQLFEMEPQASAPYLEMANFMHQQGGEMASLQLDR